MSSYAVEAAIILAEKIDDGRFIPTRELIESVSELNAAIARYAARQAKPLRIVPKQKEHT